MSSLNVQILLRAIKTRHSKMHTYRPVYQVILHPLSVGPFARQSNNDFQALALALAVMRNFYLGPLATKALAFPYDGFVFIGRQHSLLCIVLQLRSSCPSVLSVCLSVRHTLALRQNDASQDHEFFTDGQLKDSIVLAVKSSSRNSKGFTQSEGVK